MTVSVSLVAVLAELARLGVRAIAFAENGDGNPGVLIIGSEDVFTTTRDVLEDEAQRLEWAIIVASLARGVEA
jgi:hypothetical protein